MRERMQVNSWCVYACVFLLSSYIQVLRSVCAQHIHVVVNKHSYLVSACSVVAAKDYSLLFFTNSLHYYIFTVHLMRLVFRRLLGELFFFFSTEKRLRNIGSKLVFATILSRRLISGLLLCSYI
jgi:hypothetical protein